MTKEEQQKQEPTIAPGMNTQEQLEEEATDREIAANDSTSVTRLYLDRTPQDD